MPTEWVDEKGKANPAYDMDRDGFRLLAMGFTGVLGIAWKGSGNSGTPSSLDDDERGSVIVDTLGGPQEVGAVTESGLYALIFRSRKPAAVRFRKWVTSEVLPTIRSTGGYGSEGGTLKFEETQASRTFGRRTAITSEALNGSEKPSAKMPGMGTFKASIPIYQPTRR